MIDKESWEIDFYPSSKISGYRPDLQKLEKYISETRPDIFLMINPSNPSGIVLNSDELSSIARICRENKVTIISDEIAADLTNKKFHSMAEYADISECIIFYGTSKTYGSEGYKIAFAYGNVCYFQQLIVATTTDLMLEYAMILFNPHNRNLLENYDRDIAQIWHQNLNEIEQILININQEFQMIFDDDQIENYISLIPPEGGSVALLDFEKLKGKEIFGIKINSSLKMAELLLEKGSLALVPGEAFMIDPDDMVCRTCFKQPENWRKGLNNFVESLLKSQEAENHFKNEREKLEFSDSERKIDSEDYNFTKKFLLKRSKKSTSDCKIL